MVNKVPNSPEDLTPPETLDTESLPSPPSYEVAISSHEVESKRCKKKGRATRFCLACCSFYGLFCFFWTIMTLMCLCMSIGYFVSVVDSCVNPSVTFTDNISLSFQEKHPNLANISIYVSVVSGSISLKRASGAEFLGIEVIRGASSQEAVESLTSFQYTYNETHLSLIGETSSTLMDCPTVKIVVYVPDQYSANLWDLSVETGQVHIEGFYGVESSMKIHLTTGAVHIDDLVVKDLDISTNAGAIFWKDSSESAVYGAANIQTNSGYVGISELYLIGSLSVGTNTGVVSLEKVASGTKLQATGVWGVIHLSDCSSPLTYVTSDSAHICYMNSWDNSIVEFSTETGSINTDNLEYAFQKECTEDRCQIWFASDETSVLKYYFIQTVSGTVTLGNN